MKIRSLFPYDLFGRTILIILLPVLLGQLFATYIFFDRHWIRMTERLAMGVAGELAAAAEQIDEAKQRDRAVDTIKQQMATHLGVLITFAPGETGEGLELDPGDRKSFEDTLAHAVAEKVRRPFKLDMRNDKEVYVQIKLLHGVLSAQVPRNRLYDSSAYIFVLWMNGLSLVFFMISALFLRNQIRPIRKLAVAAERMGKGGDAPSFKPTGAREVRQATEAFFNMRDRIKRQVQQRTVMLAGVSHDLRTPLTRMKLQLALMEGEDADALRSDVDAMGRMIDGYLAFARGESEEPSQYLDVVPLLTTLAENQRRAGGNIVLEAPSSLSAYIKPNAISRAIQNIVDNAAKYARTAKLTAWRDEHNGCIAIQIDDDGPGIPVANYEEVFRPFYRIDASRNASSGGVGLGLSIAQDVILAHGGTISLAQSHMGGLRVLIHLPL